MLSVLEVVGAADLLRHYVLGGQLRAAIEQMGDAESEAAAECLYDAEDAEDPESYIGEAIGHLRSAALAYRRSRNRYRWSLLRPGRFMIAAAKEVHVRGLMVCCYAYLGEIDGVRNEVQRMLSAQWAYVDDDDELAWADPPDPGGIHGWLIEREMDLRNHEVRGLSIATELFFDLDALEDFIDGALEVAQQQERAEIILCEPVPPLELEAGSVLPVDW